MSIESIPQEHPSSPLINLPRPEVGGGVEGEKKDEDIIGTINFLNRNKYKVAFSRFDPNFELIKDAVNEIKKNDNYFVNAKFEQVAKKPLDNDSKWPIVMKKALIKGEIGNIEMDQIVNDSLIEKCKNDSLSDQEIEQVFSEYREFNSEYFYWLDDHDRKDDYDEKFIKDNYDIIPEIAEDRYNKLEITRDSCYSKMSNKYAAIYTPEGNVDSLFLIDQKLNLENKNDIKINGAISESHLEFYLNKFKKCSENNEAEGMHYYLQIRKNLPEEIAEDIDVKLNLSIPKELDKDFNSRYEFDEIVSSFGNETMEHFKKLDEDKKEYLINELDLLLKRRREKAGEKYFGFCSEDIEMLDFYKSFMMHSPNNIKPTAHFSIYYYLHLRKDLPKDLVEEFEEKYSIEIPENLKSFDNLDDYLDTSDKELLLPFKEPFLQKMEGIDKKMLSMDFIKMQQYLYDKIDELDIKIKATKIQPERLDLEDVLEKEGFKKENMSEDEYKKMVLTYKTLIELPMREKIENEFDIELKNFSIREQVQFVNFLSSKSIKEVEEVKEFLNQGQNSEAKNNRIRSFLSLELGEGMGKNILDIGEKLKSENADTIFAKYTEIIDLTGKSRDDLEELFKNRKEISDEEIDKIVQNLINKAGQMFVDFSESVNVSDETDKEDLMRELENYKADLILTASVYKGIDKKDGIAFEDLKGVEFESMTSGQIISDENLKKDILELYKNNGYVDVPKNSFNQILEKYSPNKNDTEPAEHIFQMMEIYSRNYENRPAFRKKLLAEFLDVLVKNKNDTHFYMYVKDEDVVAFSRFDQLEDGKILAASLNVRNIICNSHIGKIFSNKCIEKEFRNGDIIASCDAFTFASSGHLESGFVGGEVVENYNKEDKENNNIPALIIKKERGKKYDSQNLSREELIEEYNKNFKDNKFNKEDRIILKFNSKSPELLNVSKNLMNKENYVMTRYFYADKKCKEAYCVFEIGGS